ncbi:DUF7666 domain-containing protein [Gorillibacterium timonense]|uniref:DUF7666 domain-containing protein n=1 Tax=Gorillibacterium timonense TaxID=1689269 RepID=UPI00071D99FB|nr:hypothetical protein [Gorillibacterium timonense]
MKGFKAFDKGLVCRGYQYRENEVFEENVSPEVCSQGFHFCADPMDVLEYYPLIDDNGNVPDFAEVEALGPVHTEGNKSATNKIKIGAKLGLPGFVKASFDFLWEKCSSNPSEPDPGHRAQLASSGDSAQLASSGDSARLASSGHRAQLASSGDSAQLDLQGSDSVGAAVGIGTNRIRGKVGSWITLAEWVWDSEKDVYVPHCVKSAQIDGEIIKADTWYTLKDSEFMEVDI